MALLIATELFTLLFAMDVLSSVRSFVVGEGLWSKSQKDAIQAIHRYAFTHDRKFFDEFHRHLEINMGDRAARVALSQPEVNEHDVFDGFYRGGNHPDDIPGLIKLIRKFYWVHYVGRALELWGEADRKIDEVVAAANRLDRVIQNRRMDREEMNSALVELDRLNEGLTTLENQFSETLSAGSRWLEKWLMILLVFAVLTVESTGVLLTVAFSRNLNRSLSELTETATEVGKGNFDVAVPVRSRDELGQLAGAINKMSADLKNITGMRQRAESASQVKSEFLANMSHEIRTPIGVILGLTEILKDPNLSWNEQLRYVDTIERTGKNLIRIINEILDLSKVEAGHLEIQKSSFSLKDFVAELEMMLSVQAAKTNNSLRFEGEGSLPLQITTDRTRLRQILVNLVNNALKYTTEGQVTVTYFRDGAHLVFEVCDTGQGINSEDREKLFDAFVRSEDANRKEGTGLGLMLSKRLARAMGGDVNLVRSEVGKGSVFRATVLVDKAEPISAIASASVRDNHGDDLRGKKILVVEDSEDNRLLVELFLSRQGAHVDFAENGKLGFDRAMEQSYDAVLMDMQMPVMDGYRATQELREHGYKKPIIALTAHAMKEDRERCMKAGCSDYLTKPIDSRSLYKAISRQLHSQPSLNV